VVFFCVANANDLPSNQQWTGIMMKFSNTNARANPSALERLGSALREPTQHRLAAAGATLIAALIVALPTTTAAQSCPFDNGGSTLENDGLVLTRYALGLRGSAMVANAAFAVGDAATIETNIACPSCGLRVTDDTDGLGNPVFTVADATIISRKLAGFEGTALTSGLALGSGSRNNAAAVQSFLLSGCGATGGTVTSVATGVGLTGGPFTTTGTVSLGSTYRLPQTCSNGQVAKYNAASSLWECQNDNAGGGTVTTIAAGVGLTGGSISVSGTIAADTAYLQRRVSTACAAGSFITAIAADGATTCASPAAGSGSGTVTAITLGDGLTNNAALPFTSGGTITTTGTITLPISYRMPQGCAANQVPSRGSLGQWVCTDVPAIGSVFLQGGNAFGVPAVLGTNDTQPLTVGIGGGNGLRVIPTISSGEPNIILGAGSNAINSSYGATVGGGFSNSIGNSAYATITGGAVNSATGASFAAVLGGSNNAVSAQFAAVAGGQNNAASGDYSFAAGRRAKAEAQGSFVWADSTPLDYRAGLFNGPTLTNSFNVRATGGINLVTAVGATGAQTRGLNISASGTTSVNELDVQGTTKTASLSVGASGTVITGMQTGRASIPPPGAIDLAGNSTAPSCRSRNGGRLVCEVDVYVGFASTFPGGTSPRVMATINANAVTGSTAALSVIVLNVDNVGVTFRVTQSFFDGVIAVNGSTGSDPGALRFPFANPTVGWTGAYAIDWFAVAQ
jgi:hypothetical protein